jgi:hypothetical protein
VAFHPSGFHLIVGFADKVRLMNLLMEDFRTYKEIPIKAGASMDPMGLAEFFGDGDGEIQKD